MNEYDGQDVDEGAAETVEERAKIDKWFAVQILVSAPSKRLLRRALADVSADSFPEIVRGKKYIAKQRQQTVVEF